MTNDKMWARAGESARSWAVTAGWGIGVAAGVLGLLGCGGAAPKGRFPTRDDLMSLSAAPPPQHVFDRGNVDAEAFELSAPLPEMADGGAVEAEGDWQKLLGRAIANKPMVVASRGMECAARQVAAFVLEREALPAQPVVRFIAARCGVPTGSFGMGYRGGEVPAGATEESIYAEWAGEVEKDLAGAIGAGARFVGIGVARKEKRAAVVFVTARREARIEAVPLVPVDGKVVLKGELVGAGAASIRALVTRGTFGFEECIRDIDVELPRFVVECPVAAEDATARVELAAFQEGRELGDSVIDLRVYPAGAPVNAYSKRAGEAAGATDAGALGAALLERINGIRKEAGMGALRVSEAENRTAVRLAPYYFAAVSGNADAVAADRIALGLLAGWEVEGEVRQGHFTSMWIGQRAPGALVEATIDSPFGRETLLDPEASVVAIGPVVDGETLGAVFSAYSTMGSVGRGELVSVVTARAGEAAGERSSAGGAGERCRSWMRC
ncbi:MAG: hypothetical protein R3F14_15365 [Polyangiaceae bacterium]